MNQGSFAARSPEGEVLGGRGGSTKGPRPTASISLDRLRFRSSLGGVMSFRGLLSSTGSDRTGGGEGEGGGAGGEGSD